MSKEVVKGVPIVNLLYTVEGEPSTQQTKAELKVEDPTPERALGVLAGTPNKTDKPNDEQATS